MKTVIQNSSLYDEISLLVDEVDIGLRLDQYLANRLDLSRQKVRDLFDKNLIKSGSVNNAKQNIKLSQKVFLNDSFVVKIPLEKRSQIVNNPEDFLLQDFIVYEDENFLVINKPAGLLSQNKPGEDNEVSVVDLARQYLGDIDVGQAGREFIVHRLDKETSGLMVLAKNQSSYEFLVEVFKNKQAEKKYLGLVWGVPNPTCHSIKKNIVRDRIHRTKMHVSIKKDEGKEAITHYRVREILFGNFVTLVEFILETGRTHQIRAHMDFINCPILGDKLYGKTRNHSFDENFFDVKSKILNLKRHMLHSYHLSFPNMKNIEEKLEFEIDLPEDILEIINFC